MLKLTCEKQAVPGRIESLGVDGLPSLRVDSGNRSRCFNFDDTHFQLLKSVEVTIENGQAVAKIFTKTRNGCIERHGIRSIVCEEDSLDARSVADICNAAIDRLRSR